MSTAPPLWTSPVHRVLIPLLLVASLVPIWSSPYFPSQNGPWHLLAIQMLHEYGNPAFNYAEFYQPSLHAIPHLAHTLLVYALAFVFPLLVAHKIAISVYVLLLPISVFWLLATVNRSRMAVGYASFLLVYNVPLFRGYHDYVLGIPLVLLTLTYWLRSRERMTPARTVITMLLIAAVYLSHLFNFLMLGLAMLVYALYAGRSPVAIGRLALLFIPAGLMLADFTVMSLRQTHWLDTSELLFLPPHTAAESFFDSFFHTLSHTAYLLAVVPLLLGIPMIWTAVTRIYRRSGGRLRALVANPPTTLFLLCTALYFVTPYKLFGWHYVNTRFVPFVVVFLLAGLPAAPRLPRRALVSTVAIAAVGIYAILAMHVAAAGREIDEYLSALDKVRPNSLVFPLVVDGSQLGRISPLAHVYDYYPLFRGGGNGKGLARFNTVTPMVYRSYPPSSQFPNWHPDRRSDITALVKTYDYVLIWGSDAYAALRLQRAAFQLVHQEGRLQLFENRARTPVPGVATRE